jgi:hypothetical protein
LWYGREEFWALTSATCSVTVEFDATRWRADEAAGPNPTTSAPERHVCLNENVDVSVDDSVVTNERR